MHATDFGLPIVRVSGGEELVLCPFHADSTPSAWFNPAKGLFYCAVCDLGLNAASLAARLGVEWDGEYEEVEEKIPDYSLILEADTWASGITDYHPYLQERGVFPLITTRYGLSVTNDAVIFPVTDLKGKLTGQVLRYFEPEKHGTRYRKFGVMQPVWPMHFLGFYISTRRPVVVEGAFSVLKLHQYSASFLWLALLGAKANRTLVEMLSPFDPIYLYDGDTAGKRACARMRELDPLAHAYTLSVSPDDMDDEQLGKLLRKLEEL